MTKGNEGIKVVCASKNCPAPHIAGPVDAPEGKVSHGICVSCLKRDFPGAYFFGRRRALVERLAAFDAGQGIADLNGFFLARGRA